MKNQLLRVPLKYGAIGGALIVALFVVMFYSGRHPLSFDLFYDIRLLILPIFLFFAVKEFKDYFNRGILHFWQGFTISIITSLVIGLVAGLFVFIFSQFIEPSFHTQYVAERIYRIEQQKEALVESSEKIIGKEKSTKMIDERLANLKTVSPIVVALDYLLKTMGLQLFFNIIISVILRRQPKL